MLKLYIYIYIKLEKKIKRKGLLWKKEDSY